MQGFFAGNQADMWAVDQANGMIPFAQLMVALHVDIAVTHHPTQPLNVTQQSHAALPQGLHLISPCSETFAP